MKIPRPGPLVWKIVAIIWVIGSVARLIANKPFTHWGIALLIALGCFIMADLQQLIEYQEKRDEET